MDTAPEAVERTAFRPAKRRRFTRNRRASESEQADPQRDDTASPADDALEAANTSVSNILRLRKNKPRKNGLEFTNTRNRSSERPPPSTDLAVVDTEAERLKAISDRFVAHSGQVVDVDRHMVAYIDSEMAKRRLGQAVPESSNSTLDAQDSSDEDPDPSTKKPFSQRQPAAVGKIHEIDLGRDASLRNRQRTEIAMRRARGEHVPPEEPVIVKKPRLGRNGKPRRGPKRRNSDDVKRDQLVEQVLHESRLDMYDEPEAEPQEDNLNADDRVAEQFRRDFIDAMQARRRHRTYGRSKAPALKPGEQPPPRGPKLGGSRSARAAMRELREKASKK